MIFPQGQSLGHDSVYIFLRVFIKESFNLFPDVIKIKNCVLEI